MSLGVFVEMPVLSQSPNSSRMVGPSELKLGGMVEGMCQNVLAKEFFGSVNILVHQDQADGPHVTSFRPWG